MLHNINLSSLQYLIVSIVSQTIVFDMDETLVKVQRRNYKLPYYDDIIRMKYPGNEQKQIKVSNQISVSLNLNPANRCTYSTDPL